jgi:N-acetylglucosaminyldiphosphoundecaprenol N-acetyl-beta-D-mannosaminyltransferase
MTIKSLNLSFLRVNAIDYDDLIDFIGHSVNNSESKVIGYANAHTFNCVYKQKEKAGDLNKFDIIHPDGIGVHWALKYVYPDEMNLQRITGSDFYPLLIHKAIEENWSLFFFGHDETVLNKIKDNCPGLKIAGTQNGFGFEDKIVLEKINSSGPQILIIGLGFPKQEEWILRNRNLLKPMVSILVGDGIKVFAGTKTRGPALLRKLGMEWLVRLFSNPLTYWRRYLIGNPLFLYRIFRLKMAKLNKN